MARMWNGTPSDELGAAAWVKSGCSNSTGNRVEFASVGARVVVRDSKDPRGPALVFGRADVAELVAGLKAGAYDHLLMAV